MIGSIGFEEQLEHPSLIELHISSLISSWRHCKLTSWVECSMQCQWYILLQRAPIMSRNTTKFGVQIYKFFLNAKKYTKRGFI